MKFKVHELKFLQNHECISIPSYFIHCTTTKNCVHCVTVSLDISFRRCIQEQNCTNKKIYLSPGLSRDRFLENYTCFRFGGICMFLRLKINRKNVILSFKRRNFYSLIHGLDYLKYVEKQLIYCPIFQKWMRYYLRISLRVLKQQKWG